MDFLQKFWGVHCDFAIRACWQIHMASLSTMDTPCNNVESSVSCGQGEVSCVLQSVSAAELSFALGPYRLSNFQIT